jgi:hypothetical protein
VPTNFLEQLAAEWFEYRGYFVRRNVKVGKREKGGYECELDVVAFHPETKHLVHIEPSTDASKWEKREERYKKKFEAGRKYIPAMFPGLLEATSVPEQIALLVLASRKQERFLAGGRVVRVSAFLAEVVQHFKGFSMMSAQVPEGFPLLRTLQFVAEYRTHLFEQQPNEALQPTIHPLARPGGS